MPRETADRQTIHGVLMCVDGCGVLVVGESGCGKSELALELIDRGHQLVADDAVEIVRSEIGLAGSAPELTRGILAIRGLGLIDVPHLFGPEAWLPESKVDLGILLFRPEHQEPVDYLDPDRPVLTFLGVDIPLFRLDVHHRVVRPVFIETAVRMHEKGELTADTVAELERRHKRSLVQKRDAK